MLLSRTIDCQSLSDLILRAERHIDARNRLKTLFLIAEWSEKAKEVYSIVTNNVLEVISGFETQKMVTSTIKALEGGIRFPVELGMKPQD